MCNDRSARSGWTSVAFAIGATLLATACATRVVRQVDGPKTTTWIGQRMEVVESVWGVNEAAEPDGNGGRILTYRGKGGMAIPPEQHRPPFDVLGYEIKEPRANRGLPPDATYIEGDVKARFWINAEGIVYRYEFSPSVWKRERQKTVPPSAVQ